MQPGAGFVEFFNIKKNKMKTNPADKKEAPGAPSQKEKVELPGQQPGKEEKETKPRIEKTEQEKQDEADAGPLSKKDYGSQKNQSGKNTSPDSED